MINFYKEISFCSNRKILTRCTEGYTPECTEGVKRDGGLRIIQGLKKWSPPNRNGKRVRKGLFLL